MYQSSLSNLQKIGVDIQEGFFTSELKTIPLLEGVKTLLQNIDAKGLKLTAKGFLPTKVVKGIVEVAATTADKRYLEVQTRFYEQEHLSANMARVVSEVLKLVRVEKGKLFLTKKGREFLSLNAQEQYIVLFNIMVGINLGYFDGHQEASCVHHSCLIMLQLLRDKAKDFRTSEVYVMLLLDSYPILEDEIEKLELDYGQRDQLDIFISISQTRLFERFFLSLGLVEMKVAKNYQEESSFAKSALLDKFIEEKYSINRELVFSKKLMRSFQDEIKVKKLEIDLFEVSMYLFSQYAHIPSPPSTVVIDSLLQKHSVIGTLRADYEHFYEKLIKSVVTTYEEFTQLDTVGAKRDDIMDEYLEMVDTFARLVRTDKPFITVERLLIVPSFLFDALKMYHQIDYLSKDFILEIERVLGNEFAMDVGQLMLLLNKLEKDRKKLKKNKPNFENSVKEFIQTYFIIVLELYSRDL